LGYRSGVERRRGVGDRRGERHYHHGHKLGRVRFESKRVCRRLR